MKDKASTKKRMPVWGKILIAIGSLTVFSVIFFLVIDTPVIASYKLFMRQRVNWVLNDPDAMGDKTAEYRVVNDVEFEELEKKVPFKVPWPTWLPEGFELDYIDYSYNADLYALSFRYNDNDGDYIAISINTDAPENLEKTMAVDYEKVKVGDFEVLLFSFGKPEWQTIYINDQGFQIFISTVEDREILLRMIENMS